MGELRSAYPSEEYWLSRTTCWLAWCWRIDSLRILRRNFSENFPLHFLVNLCKYSAILHCIFQANLHYALWLPQNLKTMLTQSEPQFSLSPIHRVYVWQSVVPNKRRNDFEAQLNDFGMFFFFICSKSKWFRMYFVGDDCVDSFGECGRYGYEYISHYNAI